MKLLRYLSVLAIFSVIVACEDDDKITDNLPPEDANLYSFKPLTITNTVDENGNTYITSGTLNVDADISDEAAEGFSKQVVIQIVKIVDGESTELARGAAFSLSGNGGGDAQTFNLNFDDVLDVKTEVNIAANLLEAGSNRLLKGSGIIVKAETSDEDARLVYKIKSITWSDTIDRNGDGYFARRDVAFTVALEGNVTETIRGDIKLINDKTLDTTLLLDIQPFEVKREGFSTNEITFIANPNQDWERSAYEFLIEFFDVNTGELVFEEFYKAANLVRIGFEPANYDNRQYTVPGAPSVDIFNTDTSGFADSLNLVFNVKASEDLVYGSSLDFELEFPKARIQYIKPFDPESTDYSTIETVQLDQNPFAGSGVQLTVDLIDALPGGDTATYDFKIQVLEPAGNYFTFTDDVVVNEYDKDDFAVLGGVKINP